MHPKSLPVLVCPHCQNEDSTLIDVIRVDLCYCTVCSKIFTPEVTDETTTRGSSSDNPYIKEKIHRPH